MTKRIVVFVLVSLVLPFFGFAIGPSEPEGPVSGGEAVSGGMYNEAPMLAARVAAGELPPVDERLPVNPVVVQVDQIGKYGGMLRQGVTTRHSAINSMLAGRFLDGAPFTWDAAAGNLSPNWAEQGTISSDGKTFTLTIREGVKWSDGHPWTTDDIMFWYECVQTDSELTPTLPRELKRGGEPVRVEKIDDCTVRFRFKEPHGLFPEALAYSMDMMFARSPKHYLKQFHPRYVPKDQLNEIAREKGYIK